MVFQSRTIFLKWLHDQNVIFKIMKYLFLNTNCALKLQGKYWKYVPTFTAHLSITITHLTRYKLKVVLATMLEGVLALQHAGQYKSYYFVEKSECHKYLPWMRFLSNFSSGCCMIIFMCSVNFWHQQDSNSSFKGSIGHMTS